jgi:hypothetical protein
MAEDYGHAKYTVYFRRFASVSNRSSPLPLFVDNKACPYLSTSHIAAKLAADPGHFESQSLGHI